MYTSDITVQANSYQEALGILGEEMDALWGVGNWRIESCHAHPYVYWTNGRPGIWDWDFRVRPNSPRK